jgi:hypothetical protein
MIPVGVLTGHSSEAELIDAGAAIVLPSALEIVERID